MALSNISNPIYWVTENLQAYLLGDKLILGIFILAFFLIIMVFLRLPKLIIFLCLAPILLGLVWGGYLPMALAGIVYGTIAILWIIAFLAGFWGVNQ